MNISILQASKDFKVSRTTIYKKIENGELSRNPDKTIDTSEMLRVFGEPKSNIVSDTVHDTGMNTALSLQKQEIEFLKRQLQDRDNQISDYRQQVGKLNDRLDSSQDTINELSNTVKLIENKNQMLMVPKKPWYKFWH